MALQPKRTFAELGTSVKLKNLNQTLFETAEDIGRLNSVISQLEREVEELQKRLDHDESMLFWRTILEPNNK
jgi:hypothetical protein